MLELISREVSDAHLKLRAWLEDMADRPAPYGEFDLRGLTEEHRAEFWSAAERAFAAAIERYGPEETWPSNAYGAESLAHLMRMHASVLCGEPPSARNDFTKIIEFDGNMEDLDHLWRNASRTQSQCD
jgi:hypothetical protein